jgi:methionyl-tRNA synthetase
MSFLNAGQCNACGDYLRPCRCTLTAENKKLKEELGSKCDLCEASTAARSWQAENEALRQAAGELVEAVEEPFLFTQDEKKQRAATLRQLLKG